MAQGYSRTLYGTGYWLSVIGLTLGFSYRYEGRRNVPRRGPALLLSNHESFLDPLIVGAAAHRHLCFLARKTLFRNKYFGRLIRRANAVPVDQEGIAKEGLKAILERLKAGEAVLVFPEGERTRTGEMQPLKPGISLLIKRMDAPIVPVGFAGGFQAFPRTATWPRLSPLFWPATGAGIAVSIGKPIPAARYHNMPRDEVLADLHREIARCKERAERLRRKG